MAGGFGPVDWEMFKVQTAGGPKLPVIKVIQ